MGKNIYFMAEKAGVSVATISRYFNNPDVIKEETRQRIKEVCIKYNYRPSYIASAITTRRTKSIALLSPSLREPAFHKLVFGIEKRLSERGYCLNLFNTKGNVKSEMEIIEIINNRIIDGVIIAGVFGGEEERKSILELKKRKIPTISVDRYILSSNIASVAIDDYTGGRIAAEFLLKKNHTSIGLILYSSKIDIFNERKKGFIDCLRKNNLKAKLVLEIPSSFSSLKDNMEKNKNTILESKITSFFCLTDMIAITLIKLLQENKIKIPEDISIIGFDNIDFSNFIIPALTTIEHYIDTMGEIAVDNLISKIENNKYLKKITILQPKIIERDSVIEHIR